jgi:hypothetical protein
MLKSEKILTDSHTRIQKWVVWLENFDFDVEYKPGYLNCLANMLTREAEQPVLAMMSAGPSNKGKSPMTPEELAKEQDSTRKAIEARELRKTKIISVIGEQERQQLASTITREVVDDAYD